MNKPTKQNFSQKNLEKRVTYTCSSSVTFIHSFVEKIVPESSLGNQNDAMTQEMDITCAKLPNLSSY